MLPVAQGYPFPDDSLSEEEKAKPVFGLSCARALYSRYWNNTGDYTGGFDWGASNVNDILEIENYGKGQQSKQKYINWWTNFSQIGKGKKVWAEGRQTGGMDTQSRKAFANIDYEVQSPLGKISAVALSLLALNDYKPRCVSTDSSVLDEKVRKRLEILYAAKVTNPLAQELGLPPMEIPFAPRDEQHAKMMEETGMLKARVEQVLENLAEATFRYSRWKDIRQKYNRNALDLNFRCVKLENEPNTGATYVRHVIPASLVMLWNQDYQDDPVAIGDTTTISVQALYPQMIADGYTEEQIKTVCKQYENQFNNVQYASKTLWTERDTLTNRWKWMDFLVPVLKFEYLTTDHKQYVKGVDKTGKSFYTKNFTPLPDNKKAKERQYDDFKCNYWYEGTYIIASEIVIGWRKKPNQNQKQKLNPVSSYVFGHIEGSAPTQRVKALCDDLMFGVLKLRCAVWAAAPSGFMIDIGDGARIKIGGVEYDVFDLIHLYRQNGVLLRSTKYNSQLGKVVVQPIAPIEGGLGPQGDMWMKYIADKISEILDTYGMPAIVAASTESAEKAVGIVDNEVISTNHALFPYKQSEVSFTEKVSERIINQIRIDIANDPKIREYYEGILGKEEIAALDTIKDMTMASLGLVMDAMPTDRQKDIMMQRAQDLAMQGTRDGVIILRPSDLEYAADLLQNGEIRAFRFFLAEKETEAIERAQKNKVDSEERTFKGQQETLMVGGEEARKTIDMQHTKDLERIAAETAGQIEIIKAKFEHQTPMELQKIALKGDIEDNQIDKEIVGEIVTGQNVKNQSNQKAA